MSIENQLIEFVVEITDISSEELALTGSLLEYGFDSISLTELSNRINAVYPGATTPAILLEYDSLGEIAAFLQQPGSVEIVPVAEPPKGLTMADMMLNQAAPVITSGAATPVTAAPVAAEPFKDSTLVQAPTPKQTAQGVAIIGVSCHYPQSPDPAAYWQTIVNNQNAITALPEARKAWCDKALFAQSDYSFASGFIDDIDLFDADYFGISAREARMMDPQQRLMLEHALKALGDAGYDKAAIAGTDTGVFVGAAASDYQNLLVKRGLINSHYSTGVDHSIIANRVSYHFDLNGPSEVINTACSSSLVALNRAKRAIESGECQTALVGGIGCIIDQHLTEGFNQAGMLSPDNRCKTFDESANGYVRGEGIGVVMLKSLVQAEIDGDRIYAALIGSASNHGGAVRS
jgi:acyl carrier protein